MNCYTPLGLIHSHGQQENLQAEKDCRHDRTENFLESRKFSACKPLTNNIVNLFFIQLQGVFYVFVLQGHGDVYPKKPETS